MQGNSTLTGILTIVGIVVAVVIILVIRYAISRAVHKGADAIRNAVVDKKNTKSSKEPENLADRYRQDNDNHNG